MSIIGDKKNPIYASIGRGGWSVHFEKSVLSHYGNKLQELIDLGIPVKDTRTIPEHLIGYAISIPMIATDRPPEERFTSMSYESVEYVFGEYEKLGAKIYNLKEVADGTAT